MKTLHSNFLRITCIALLLAVAVTGCLRNVPATKNPLPEGADKIEILYQQAEGYYRNRFYAKAFERYMSIVETAPDSTFAAPSLYKIAGIRMKTKDYQEAILYFDKLVSEYPRSQFSIEANYHKGFCYLKLGDPEKAIDALENYLVLGKARHVDRARMYLAESQAAVGEYVNALVNYAAASQLDLKKKTRVEILSNVKKIVDQSLSLDDLRKALSKAPECTVTDYLNYRLAAAVSAKGESGEAVARLQNISFGRAQFSFYREADRLLGDLNKSAPSFLDAKNTPDYTIGVVLPLTGKFAIFGEQVLQGVMLAVDTYQQGQDGRIKIEVLIKDSKGSAENAVAAVRELASNPHVLAIVGPLMKKPSIAAANEAQLLEIPLVTLATHEPIADIGPWTFRNAMTLSMQVKALIRYAHQQKGCRRFAILHPSSKLGNTYADLFVKYIDPVQNDITAKVAYEPGTADFRAQVRALKGNGRFDALFIPDSADKIAQIAPQLVYFGVKGEVLLGTPAWNRHILAKKGRGYLDDTVIVDSFFVDSTKPHVRAFAALYKDEFDDPPTHLSGHGFDTVAILTELLQKGFGEGRSSLRSGLLGVRDFEGVTGVTTILENGDVFKELILLRVGPHRIEELF